MVLDKKPAHETSASLPSTARAENQIVDEAVQIISQRICEKITLEDLADAVHVSVSYLCRIFNMPHWSAAREIHYADPPGGMQNAAARRRILHGRDRPANGLFQRAALFQAIPPLLWDHPHRIRKISPLKQPKSARPTAPMLQNARRDNRDSRRPDRRPLTLLHLCIQQQAPELHVQLRGLKG